MRSLFVSFLIVCAVSVSADDLGALKAAARRYVAAMKGILALPDASDCSETIAGASEYAAAKIAYYAAARRAMPALLAMRPATTVKARIRFIGGYDLLARTLSVSSRLAKQRAAMVYVV
jgi:hypothetical protein